MMTNKGYYIPKYLYRRKIELIRLKIIKRKYGYLFYRKTVSTILPSQAERHYALCLQRKCIKKWILHWYEEIIEWKLVLRAEIHYNLSVQHNTLRKWKYFIIQRKAIKIKEKIAVVHSENKYKIRLLHYSLYKWRLYMKCKSYKKDKLMLAWTFFKSKYNPECLRSYFKRWRILTSASKKNKLRLVEAEGVFRYKLVTKAFTKLVMYSNNKKITREVTEIAIVTYNKNLKQKVLNDWISFTKIQQQKASNKTLAETHYYFKLKSNYFARLLDYLKRNQRLRQRLDVFKNIQNNKLKLLCFGKLKTYSQQRSVKQKKMALAAVYFDIFLKKKMIHSWKEYINHCKDSRLFQKQLLNAAIKQLNFNKVKHIFEKWKVFKAYEIEKKHKIQTATNYNTKRIFRRVIRSWEQFLSYRKTSRHIKVTMAHLYCQNLIRKSLKIWKTYTEEEKTFREKLKQAKDYYRQNIISESILLIIRAGLNKKEQNLRKSKEKFGHQLFLAQKYLSIWKQNALYKNIRSNTIENLIEEMPFENKENVPRISNLEWYQICFLTPRVPKNYLQDHFDNS